MTAPLTPDQMFDGLATAFTTMSLLEKTQSPKLAYEQGIANLFSQLSAAFKAGAFAPAQQQLSAGDISAMLGQRNSIFNVLDYGADPVAQADSTDAIQSAIDDSADAGGVAMIPPGTYNIRTLTFPSNQRVRLAGSGRYVTTLQSIAGGDMIVMNHTHQRTEFGCEIRDLTLAGNASKGRGIVTVQGTVLGVTKVVIRNIFGTAIYATSLYDSVFNDVFVEACGAVNFPAVYLTSPGDGGLITNNNQFYGLHIESANDCVFLQMDAPVGSFVDKNQFFGLKVHGAPGTSYPTRPLIRLNNQVIGCSFFGGIVAFGRGECQIECGGNRNVFVGTDFGVGGTPPDYAVKFLDGGGNIFIAPNFKTSNYNKAMFYASQFALRNAIIAPTFNLGTGTLLEDHGRTMYIAGDIGLANGYALYNADGFNYLSTHN